MVIGDWTKLLCVILVIAAAFILGFYEKLPGEAVASIISACLGYVFGNSHAVFEKKEQARGR